MPIRVSRLSCRLIKLSAFVNGVLLLVASGVANVPPATERSVLVPYSERGDLPAIEAFEENMRQVLHASTSPRIELFSEYLDFARFPAEQPEKFFVRNLRERYAGRQIDLVLPADAEVRLLPPGLWETHRTLILVVTGVIFLEAALIGGLVMERIWRRRAEVSLRQSEKRVSLAAEAANLEALRESEASFRTMADTAPLMIWMSGTDKLYTFFNKGWLNFTGRPLEQELGNGWVESVHSEDLDDCLEVYVSSFEARRPFTMEYRLRREDGEYRWVLDIGRPRFASDSAFLGYIGSCIDITERKQAQDRFRLVVEASPTGIVLVDPQGNIVLVNARAEKLFGYGREELIGQPIELLVPERFRGENPAHRAGFHAAPTVWAMGAGRELFCRRKDASEFPVEIGTSPIQSPEGPLVLSAIVDITERKQAEAEARKHREELAHLSRVTIMGELAASLAHELNQPLTGIVNNASAGRRFIAKGRADLPKLDCIFEAVVADGRRAGEIIQGIRAMVHKDNQVRAHVNLNDVIASVLRLVHSDALERHCVLVTKTDPELPLVEGDQVQLQQVLLNLLVNGFEAMGETPLAERRVIICSEHESDGRVRVSVRDFGTGLPPKKPEQIFEHFFTTKRQGLGMGLAIVRSIVSSHGGELAAVNAEGGGTCVYFSLPAVAERAA